MHDERSLTTVGDFFLCLPAQRKLQVQVKPFCPEFFSRGEVSEEEEDIAPKTNGKEREIKKEPLRARPPLVVINTTRHNKYYPVHCTLPHTGVPWPVCTDQAVLLRAGRPPATHEAQ